MTEYCTPDQVRQRLTTAGTEFFADDNDDGQVSATELADNITTAIQWAGWKIDEVLENTGCRSDQARGAGNGYLQNIAIDLAAYRASTNGGGDEIASLKTAFDDAKESLKQIRGGSKIPGLTFPYPFQHANMSHRFPVAINPRRN